MTIKKPMKVTATATAPASGGAAIASRLRLDAPDPAAVRAASVSGLKPAFIAALVSLIITGLLAYMLYRHWEFLMQA